MGLFSLKGTRTLSWKGRHQPPEVGETTTAGVLAAANPLGPAKARASSVSSETGSVLGGAAGRVTLVNVACPALNSAIYVAPKPLLPITSK